MIENEEKLIEGKTAKEWMDIGTGLGSNLDEKCIDCFDKALKLAPNDDKIWHRRGFALFSMERFEDAIKCFDKALELNPISKDQLKRRLISNKDMEPELYRHLDVLISKSSSLKHIGRKEEANRISRFTEAIALKLPVEECLRRMPLEYRFTADQGRLPEEEFLIRQREEEGQSGQPEEQVENGAIWEQSKQLIDIKTTILKKTQKEVEKKGFLGFGKGKKIVNEFIDIEIANQVEIRQNSIGMKFALIPEGEFMMGSEEDTKPHYIVGKPLPIHRVKISKPFYLGIYPVTQREWKEVMGINPSTFKGDNLPVETVSWNDVQEFIKKMNKKEGSNKYRLPSDAEWEYAARAGTITTYSFGEDKSKLGDYAWYYENSGGKTHDVGQKKPNLWGLYDMHGNVAGWVQDKWHDNYNGAPTDGSSWESGDSSDHVIRGGSWGYVAEDCRSSLDRFCYLPENGRLIGFRLLRVL